VALARTLVDSFVGTTSMTHTESGMSVGTASADRGIVVTITSRQRVNSVTLDGNSMREDLNVSVGTGTVYHISVWFLAWPTGTTATLVLNMTAGTTSYFAAIYAVTGDGIALGDTASGGGNAQTADAKTIALDMDAGAISVYAMAVGNPGETVTWTDATEDDAEDDPGGNRRHEAASYAASGTETPHNATVDWATGDLTAVWGGVSYNPVAAGLSIPVARNYYRMMQAR
jgi:hypothetical protein